MEPVLSGSVEGWLMERRSQARVRSVLKAEIRFNSGLMHVPCVIRDITEVGARLDLGGDVTIPERFDLFIEKKHRTRRAVVRWKNKHEAGVAFDDAPEHTAEQPIVARINELETELSTLRPLLRHRARALATITPHIAASLRRRPPKEQ